MKKTKLTAVVSVAAAACLLLSTGALACSDISGTAAKQSGTSFTESIETALDALVEAGTITSDQEAAVLAAFTPSDSSSGEERCVPERTSPLSALVEDGTLTSDEADAVEQALKGVKFSDADAVETALDTLVEAGTITSDQEEAVLAALPSGENFSGGEKGAGSNRTSPLEALVEAGTLTSDEKDAVEEALKGVKFSDADAVETALDALVEEGTITSDQEEAVLAALPSDENFSGGEKGKRTSPLDALVEAGTITSDQAAAILEAVKDAMPAAGQSQMGPGQGGLGGGQRSFGGRR